MMDVIPAKDSSILEVCEKDGMVFVRSQEGTLRIIPQKGGIVRVSFSSDGSFAKEQGSEYSDFTGSIDFKVDQSGKELSISTKEGAVHIDKETSAVSFWDQNGRELVSERNEHPRDLERIPLYRTINADKALVEEIVTPDGVKKKVKAAEREEYGSAYKTRTYFNFSEDELLIGFGQGEKGEWNLRKSTYYVHQSNRKIAIPMMVSSRNYGLLYSTGSLLMFSENEREAFVQTEADFYLDYYVLFGESLFDVVKNYRRLTGKAAMLPMWAYGYIQSKERYVSQKDILDTAGEFRKRNIGVDCMVLDWMSWEDNKWGQKSFDTSRFPDPKGMTDKLHDMGIRFMMSIWPNMAKGTENNAEFKENELLLPGTDIYNAFSDEGRKLYWSQVERALYPAGVDAWWCDSSEPITPEWEHRIEPADSDKYYEYKNDSANIMPFEKANEFGKYHAQAIWEGQRKCSLEKRVVNLTRSGWAGSQKYGTILWSGDISASWDTLKDQVRSGLQFAASGMPYWTMDTGAFFVKRGIQWFWDGNYKDGIDEAYKKLYVRWLEYAAFLPVFRAHGTDIEREPWAFGDSGDAYYEAICSTIRNRYKLLPYLYSVGAGVHFDDGMLIRPLMFDFNADEKALAVSDQFMLGDSLMVCPMIEDADQRNVYLPKGCDWYEFNLSDIYDNGKDIENLPCRRFEGGQTIEYTCGLDNIPVFVKAGSIIPVKKPLAGSEYMKDEDIDVLVYPGCDAEFSLYEDAGDGYGYESGEFSITRLIWNDKEKAFSYETSGDDRFFKPGFRPYVLR